MGGPIVNGGDYQVRSTMAVQLSMASVLELLADMGTAVLDIQQPGLMPSEIEGAIMALRGRTQAVIDWLRLTHGFEAEALVKPLTDASAALLSLGEVLIASKPPLIEVALEAETTLAQFVWGRYRDLGRMDEVTRLNGLRNPNHLMAGSVLRVYTL